MLSIAMELSLLYMRTGGQILTLLLLTSVSGCNLSKVMDRKVSRSYSKDHYHRGYITDASGETNLRYHTLGNGKDTLVLIHGFGPVAPQHWAHQIEALKKDHFIVIPELIYFGGSTSSSQDFSPQFQAQMLKNLADSLELGDYHLGGVSYGGLVASLLAHLDSSRVKSLTIVDGLSKFLTASHTDSLAKANGHNHITDILIPQDYEAQKDMVRLAFYDFGRSMPRIASKMMVKSFFTDGRQEQISLIRYLEENEEQMTQVDYRVDIPIQLHWGKDDPIIPLRTGKELQEYYGPGTQLIVYDSCRHVPNYEDAVSFNRHMMDFLDSLEQYHTTSR